MKTTPEIAILVESKQESVPLILSEISWGHMRLEVKSLEMLEFKGWSNSSGWKKYKKTAHARALTDVYNCPVYCAVP